VDGNTKQRRFRVVPLRELLAAVSDPPGASDGRRWPRPSQQVPHIRSQKKDLSPGCPASPLLSLLRIDGAQITRYFIDLHLPRNRSDERSRLPAPWSRATFKISASIYATVKHNLYISPFEEKEKKNPLLLFLFHFLSTFCLI